MNKLFTLLAFLGFFVCVGAAGLIDTAPLVQVAVRMVIGVVMMLPAFVKGVRSEQR